MSAVFFALVFALLNKLLFLPIAIVTLPIMIVTLTLFRFVINAFLLWLADKVVKGVEIESFGAALLGAIVVTFFNWGITVGLHMIGV
jgi:putative membrane protein